MADAVELAAAYVSIVPSFEGGREKISKELIPGAERGGSDAGKAAGKGFTGGMSAAKIGLAGVGAGLGLTLMDSFVTAVDQADATAKMAAQMDLDPAQTQTAGAAAGALYADAYGESLTDVNTAVSAVMASMDGMKDASQADLEDITGKAMNLAQAFEVDVAEATNTAGILMRTGLATDADQAMDLITASMQKLPASVRGEVLPVMDEYSKHFSALGIDGTTAMGMITAAGGEGAIGMDKMGDALKEFTIRSTDMSKSTSTAYDTLGLNTEDMTRRLLAGGDSANSAMAEIVHGLQSVQDPAEQSALSLALFGTPLEDLGTDQIPGFLGMVDPMGDSFDSVAGSADKFGTTLNSGPGPALEALKRSVETAFVPFMTQALPALTAVAQWVGQNSWVLGVLAGIIGVSLVAAFVAWAASAWAVTIAMLANPVTWIIVGIVALIAALVLLIANWDSVVAFVSEIWGGFISWAGSIFTDFGRFLSDAWSGIASWFQGALNGWVSWWNGIWSGLASFATGIFNGFVGFVSGIPGRIMAGLAFLASLPGIVGGWIAGMVSVAIGKFGELLGFVAGIPGQVLGALGNVGGILLDAGAQIIQGFLSGLQSAFEGVKSFVGGIADWIAANKGPKAYDIALLKPAGGWIMGGFLDSIESHMPALRSLMADVTDTIQVGGPNGLAVAGTVSGAPAPVGGYAAAPAGAGRETNITVNNPVPEPAGRSIATTLAKVAYLGLEGAD